MLYDVPKVNSVSPDKDQASKMSLKAEMVVDNTE